MAWAHVHWRSARFWISYHQTIRRENGRGWIEREWGRCGYMEIVLREREMEMGQARVSTFPLTKSLYPEGDAFHGGNVAQIWPSLCVTRNILMICGRILTKEKRQLWTTKRDSRRGRFPDISCTRQKTNQENCCEICCVRRSKKDVFLIDAVESLYF